MARYGNTILTSAGLDLAKRTVNGTSTFKITRVVTSSDSTLQNATIEQVLSLTSLNSIVQTGTVTAFDTSNPKQIGLKAQFVNRGLTDQYKIFAVGIYAQEAGKSEILYAVTPAIDPETMPARPSDSEASFTFTLQIYAAVANSSSVTISATTEGVVKSVNGTFKPDANGDLSLPFQSQADANQLRDNLTTAITNEATARANADSSVLTQAKAYTDDAKTSLTTSLNNNYYQKTDIDSKLSAATQGVVKSINGSLKPDANGDLALSVGGRNLLTNTKTLSGIWSGDTETVDGFTVAKATQTYSQYYEPLQWHNLVLKPNTDYVLSFYAKASKQTQIISRLYNIGADDSVITDGATPNTLTTDYRRYVVHFQTAAIPTGRKVACTPVRLTENGVTVWTYGVQLEEGNVATQWQPNPDDTDQAISKVSADLASEATARTNADSSVLSQAKAYTDASKAAWIPTVITTAVDLNTIKTCGSYFIQNTLGTNTNTPIPDCWLYLRVEGVPTRITQTVWKDLDPATQWVRVFTGRQGTNWGWENWVQITKAI